MHVLVSSQFFELDWKKDNMNTELLNIVLSSPVLVAVVGVVSAVLTSIAQNSLSDKEAKDIDMHDANAKKIDDIHSISKSLDRHINNSEEPFRKQMNDKLDLISIEMNSNRIAIESILENSKSTNTAIKSISSRIGLLEDKVECLEEERAA